jgi:hypothetical protein
VGAEAWRGPATDALPSHPPRHLLKGDEVSEILPNLWPIGVFLLAAGTVALVRYRETLD